MFKIKINPLAFGPVAIACPHDFDVCPKCDGVCVFCSCTPACLGTIITLCGCECHEKISGNLCGCKI